MRADAPESRPLLRRWRALTPRRAIVITIVVAAIVRLWCLAGVPLTITNDGVWYLMWGWRIVEGTPIEWPVVRTPGYSLLLAALFGLLGTGPVAILVGQHALGVLIAALITAIAARCANARLGLVLGLLAALDPVILGMECYALSEIPAAAVLLVCVALVILARRRTKLAALLLGLSLGYLCLVRPAFQIIVPFVALGWICIPREGWRWRLGGVAAIGLGFLVSTGAWLVHNWRAGFIGFSNGNSVIFWLGVNQAGLLTEDFPLPERVRSEYDRLVRPDPLNDNNNLLFINTMGAWDNPEVREPLVRWAVHSVRARPWGYLRAAAIALGWQIEIYPKHARFSLDDTKWLICRLGEDGRTMGNRFANYSVSGTPDRMDSFAMPPARGPFRRYFRWWARRWWLGAPRVILFACTVLATLIAAYRRQWPIALALLGTLAYTGAHAVHLLWPSRYSMPTWIVWWIAPAVIVGAIAQRRRVQPIADPIPPAAA